MNKRIEQIVENTNRRNLLNALCGNNSNQADNEILELIEYIQKQQRVLDKIKEYIKEEKEEYEKGKLLYKEFGKELEQYTKGQLVAYNHILELLEEIE